MLAVWGRMVVDICCYVKDSIACLDMSWPRLEAVTGCEVGRQGTFGRLETAARKKFASKEMSLRCLERDVFQERNCNVMLCALKWLGLLCKSRLARLVLLLTGRVVLLADVASAYLEMHFTALKPQDLEGKEINGN